eukprot:TRINITY_DN7149_c0_g2_i1.p1 TRINITY_DN7149_c0_g2~~TRINITY_DN7149_c0_g2_i1.p1  ORF type:complete len:766 (-),score=70.93 TRINITY_DN7149_c0_g2_i1:418-2715(-)
MSAGILSSSREAYSGKTLCFTDARKESAFVASRYAKLCKSAMFGSLLSSIFVAATLASAFALEEFDTSTDGELLYRVRTYVLLGFGVFCLLVVIIVKISQVTSCISGRNLEIFLSISACWFTFFIIAQHPWYLGKMLRLDDPRVVMLDERKFNEDSLLLYLDVWLTGCHLVLRIRWVFMLYIEIFCTIAYCIAALGLQAQTDEVGRVLNMCLLFMLTLAASWGKRALEIHERTAFAQLALERTLRYEAEHKLSKLTQSKEIRRDADATSLATSLQTAEVFDLHAETCIEKKLQSIVTIGLKEHWLIKPEALQLVEKGFIGNGAFGAVMLAQYHGSEVVLKVPYDRGPANTEKMLRSFAVELRIFRRLHHPNIVAFHGACVDLASAKIVLVLEYVCGTPLEAASTCLPDTPMAVGERWRWADNICAALAYLHAQSPSIVHGDVKDSNVLVEEVGGGRIAKLLDFGLSRLLTGEGIRVGGTVRWMAPEVILGDENAASTKVDVFSFGRLLYKIMTGCGPLRGSTAKMIRQSALSGSCLPLIWPDSMPLFQETKDLCDRCSQWAAAARPEMINVQSTLREWRLHVSIEDDIKEALRQVFPRSLSSDSLCSVLASMRAECAESGPSVTKPLRREGDTHREHRGQSRSKVLIKNDFAETLDRAKFISLMCVISRWNVPRHRSCCSLHARTRALEEILQNLRTHKCDDMQEGHTWQCNACGLFGFGVCEYCSGSSDGVQPSPEEQQHHQLTSISEELKDEKRKNLLRPMSL